MATKSEFSVEISYPYDRSSPNRWILSHIRRYWHLALMFIVLFMTSWSAYSYSQVLIGHAADEILNPTAADGLLLIALAIIAILFVDGVSNMLGNVAIELVGQRLERDVREELYVSLLGKSQTFHNRQRVGDIMARATDDANRMNAMITPGVFFVFETAFGILIPVAMIGAIRPELLLVPVLFIGVYVVAVWRYAKELNPIVERQRAAFGTMNAGLEESISGIEVVKASAQERFERRKFYENARRFRDAFVAQGRVEARYLPLLFYSFALGLVFLHAVYLHNQPNNPLSIPEIIAVMGLMSVLRFPVFASIFSFSLIQTGRASAARILELINTETELDENPDGYDAPMRGEVRFESVSFGYPDGMILHDISFTAYPGQTVAIVGQTGSGKTRLTELMNRTYDVTSGRILIDGVDVRDWSLDALRSQISRIEQDVFLFSRSVAENIAFGAPDATQEQIEQAARAAQAHEFISGFAEGYETVIGERGMTLSGGQRQRIALARAFLSDPRILILDDSTSAIDSATEDEIQKAIRQIQKGRTTFLITHRLSQIRWADHILVIEKGRIVASGTHDELLRTSRHYRRVFARYDMALPPLEENPATLPAGN